MAKKKREPDQVHPTTPPHPPKVDVSSPGLENQKKAPEKRVIPSLDEFGIADRVQNEHGHLIRYLTDAKVLMVHDGHRYGAFAHIIEKKIKDVIESLHLEWDGKALHVTRQGTPVELEEHKAFRSNVRKFSTIGKTIKLLRLPPELQAISNNFDADIYALNTLNGVLNLDTGEITPHHPGQLVTKLAPVSWEPHAECVSWEKFLGEITCGDKELEAYLQRLMGYGLSGSTQEEVMAIFYGKGANGKSVFLNHFRKMLGSGEYVRTLGAESLLSSKHHGIRADLFQLQGIRLALAIEVNAGRTFDLAMLKSLTGGDEINAEAKFKNPTQFVPTAKIIMAVNHLPGLTNIDHALKRRVHVVPFHHRFKGDVRKEDIERKFDAEMSGILRWAVEGFQAWRTEGLNPPQIVRDATEAYFASQDHIGQFLEERTVRVSGQRTPVRMMFESYEDWTRASGVQSVGLHRFGDLLRSKGFVQVRDNSTRYWADLVLRSVE